MLMELASSTPWNMQISGDHTDIDVRMQTKVSSSGMAGNAYTIEVARITSVAPR